MIAYIVWSIECWMVSLSRQILHGYSKLTVIKCFEMYESDLFCTRPTHGVNDM